MGIARATNISIGALTLLMSLVATGKRYGVEGGVSPSIVLTAAIFSFTAITLIMSLGAGTTSSAGQGNAGVIWLVLLLLTAAATWELIPAADRPAIGLVLALVVGVAIGAAVGPGIDLGSDGSSRPVVESSVLSGTAGRRRRREGR